MSLSIINPGIDTSFSSKLNNNFNYSSPVQKVYPYTGFSRGLLKWSDTRFEMETHYSEDACLSWSSGGYGSGYIADNTGGAYGVAIASGTPSNSNYTTNAGGTWTASTTAPANATNIYCINIYSSTLAVCGGTASSGNYIWYTTDGGDNWSQATTAPTVEVLAIAMASSTIGYAIDGNSNIWKTTDGGVNWADTGDNCVTGAVSNGIIIKVIDTDNILINSYTALYLSKYTNSTNSSEILLRASVSTGNGGASNIELADNGNYYFLYINSRNDGAITPDIKLVEYDGTYFSIKTCGIGFYNASNTFMSRNTKAPIRCMAIVDNTILLNMTLHTCSFNISGV